MAEGSQTSQFSASRVLVPVDYVDSNGLRQRVLLPPGETDVREGIPAGISLDSLYGDCPISFKRRLYEELFAQGLIEPHDFLRPGAAERVRSALLAAVQRDTTDIISLAREMVKP